MGVAPHCRSLIAEDASAFAGRWLFAAIFAGAAVQSYGCTGRTGLEVSEVSIEKCGNGKSEAGEACDDGIILSADGCSSACAIEAGFACSGQPAQCVAVCLVDTPCATDNNDCTDDVCNSAGICTHPHNTASCDDGLFCNGADTCAAGVCTHAGDSCSLGLCDELGDACALPQGLTRVASGGFHSPTLPL